MFFRSATGSGNSFEVANLKFVAAELIELRFNCSTSLNEVEANRRLDSKEPREYSLIFM